MYNLNEQIEATGVLLDNIKTAIKEKGVDVSNLTPQGYPDAIKSIIGDTTVNNIGFLPILIFKYSETRPNIPDGGSWDPSINQILPPNDWYTDIEQDFNSENRLLGLWMSIGVFANDGTMYKRWSTPVRISGRDGTDGRQGEPGLPGNIAGVTQFFNTPLFTISNQKPNKPNLSFDIINNDLDGLTQSGWNQVLNETKDTDIVWQCFASYNTSSNIVTCTDPVRISAESSKVRGNNRYYKLSDRKVAPDRDSSWTIWSESVDIAPTESEPFLYVYDETVYDGNNVTVSPVYLMATYVAGLLDIDLNYTCAPSEDEAKNMPSNFWFQDSEKAITKSDDGKYKGLNEDTKYLWCRETYEFSNKAPQHFYSIISYYKAAEKAPILYSAGTFNPKVTYERTEDQCPYVFYPDGLKLDAEGNISSSGKEYNYFFLKNSYEEKEGLEFEEAYNKEYWRKIESFEAIYSDIGIFKAAEVGKFVFDQKYMFSQFGKDKDGSDKYYSYYSDYDESNTITEIDENGNKTNVERKGIAVAIEDGTFIPSALINAVTGESWFANKNAYFNPNGDWKLGNDDQYIKNESGKITLQDIKLSWNNVTDKDDVATKGDLPTDYVTTEEWNSLNIDDKISTYITNKKSSIASSLKNDILNNISKTDLTTKIGDEYIETGTVIANEFLAEDIYGKSIKNDSTGSIWAINSDGSGWFAKKNIEWKSDGTMTIDGDLIVGGTISSSKLDYSGGLLSGGKGSYAVNKIIVTSGSMPKDPEDDCVYIII